MEKGDVREDSPSSPTRLAWGLWCTHTQLTESLAMGSQEASGESCEDSTVGQHGWAAQGHGTQHPALHPQGVWFTESVQDLFPFPGLWKQGTQPCCPRGSASSGGSEFWFTTRQSP